MKRHSARIRPEKQSDSTRCGSITRWHTPEGRRGHASAGAAHITASASRRANRAFVSTDAALASAPSSAAASARSGGGCARAQHRPRAISMERQHSVCCTMRAGRLIRIRRSFRGHDNRARPVCLSNARAKWREVARKLALRFRLCYNGKNGRRECAWSSCPATGLSRNRERTAAG